MTKKMDRTLNILNRILLGLTAIYVFMAVLGAFSSDPAVDDAEVVFLCYGATTFFLFLSSLSLQRKVAEICAIIAYGCFAFSVACGLFGLSIAWLAAGVAVIVAMMRQRYQNLDSVFLTGCMLSYWMVMYGFSVTLIGKTPLITKGWDVIFYPFYYEGIKHIALSWRGLLILLGGWLFARFVDRERMAAHQAAKQPQVEATVQVYTEPARSAQRVSVASAPVAAAVLAAPAPPLHQESADEEEYEDEDEFIEDNEEREEVLQAALAALDAMIGLAPLKAEIKSFIKQMQGHLITQRRGKITSTKPTLHMVFTGPPGTGKTEVARILADLLYGMEMTDRRVLVEADRSSIVAQHIGHTEANMIRLIDEAWGGVLFIDEAYALAKADSTNDFGQEAIDVLIKAMEDYREHLVVIMAGYASDMQRFLDMNQGFRSRVPYMFAFTDYTPVEIGQIVLTMLEAKGYDCGIAETHLPSVIDFCHQKGNIEGNGRWARNFVERVIKEHNVRVSEIADPEGIGKILPDDLRLAAGMGAARAEGNNVADGKRELREEAMQELHAMVGLVSLKNDVQTILHHFEVEQQRMKKGFATEKISMHMLFSGPPGTGKTTVARIIGKFLNGLGLLANGHVVETDRGGIIGRYVGHTSANMKELIAKAKGGVLFIDEAYALANSYENDFGREAIDVLVKAMEDHRGDLVVILAGYSQEMKKLLDLNPGLSSRIPFRFDFVDYAAHEIIQIVKRSFASKQFVLTARAVDTLEQQITALSAQADGVLEGNGRWARNLVDKIRMTQNNRLAQTGSSELMTIQAEDILAGLAQMK